VYKEVTTQNIFARFDSLGILSAGSARMASLGRTSSNFEVESGFTCVNSPRRNYSFSRIQNLEGHVAHNTKGHGW